MKKIGWILGTVLACVLLTFIIGFIAFGITIVTSMVTGSSTQATITDALAPVIVLVWAALIILSTVMWKRWNVRCLACKRWGAVRIFKTELLKQEDISVRMELEHRNFNGQVTGTHDQYIPGKRKTYRDTYQCRYCGNLETRVRTEKKASI